jgi:FtsZ-binding cell division protein ZapB
VFNYIDYSIKNTEKWPRHWDTWLDEWAQKCGAKYFEEILGNPKYHFYFLGVKIISLECDVERRLHRCRPRAVADLIALRKRYSYNVIIPPISEKSQQYVSIIDKLEVEINELIKKGGKINEKNKEICIEYNTDIPKFINTIIYALHTRYRMTFTIEEIKRELNMEIDEKKERYANNLNNSDFKKNIKIIIKKK